MLTMTPFRIDPQTLDFQLPDDLIAQEPLENRDQARLLVLNRKSGEISHRVFTDLKMFLKKGDVLVLNNARVSRAKVEAKKSTGGRVDIIFLSSVNGSSVWRALIRPVVKEGTQLYFSSGAQALHVGRNEQGENLLKFNEGIAEDVMDKEGRVPLPPYIKRSSQDYRRDKDETFYQTVYASQTGSVAAPTAGLHFSDNLLQSLRQEGVIITEILLHVGWGTFRPISKNVNEHIMLPERFEVSNSVFDTLCQARNEGRRIIAVGTTSTRVLESLSMDSKPRGLKGESALFIKPGFPFQWISGLVTNLHVPKSTPVALTSAFSGLSLLEKAYEEAIRKQYRFFSYGDAMLVI